MNVLRPEDILTESFRIIDEQVGRHSFDERHWPIVRRMIHASGDLDLVPSVRFHNDPVTAGLIALARQTPIVTDVTMVQAGIHELSVNELGGTVQCFLNTPGIAEQAKQAGVTRTACGIEQAIRQFPDAIYVVGNAPTALFALCSAVRQERARPALIVAMPVGFVAVVESKEEALRLPVPVITVLGRKGGSALAAAAVNALLQLALANGVRKSSGSALQAPPLAVIGIGQDGPAGLSSEARAHLASARTLAGGKRHLAFFPNFTGEKIFLEGPLSGWVEKLKARDLQSKTVVLSTGDPLFYGVGRLLLDAFPRDELLFVPHVSSVALAFARLKEPWHDACVVSLHGRPQHTLCSALQRRESKLAVLTDANNHPAAIARFLCEQGLGRHYALWVCENLGSIQERITSWIPAELVKEDFAPLNLVVLLRVTPEPDAPARDNVSLAGASGSEPLLGLPESALLHRTEKRGLITKREVRLAALAYLELHPANVFWDIGAGSGSVSLEAARLSPTLGVYAVEKGDAENLRENIAKLSPGNITLISGEAPECLESLPDPDAVFIGGSGGRLLPILEQVIHRLKPGGRLVLSCITLETLAQSWTWLAERELQPVVTSLQLAHSRPLGRLHCLEPEHPLFLLRVKKQ